MTPAAFISKAELAKHLAVSTRTINNYMVKGCIPPPVKVGRKALWPIELLTTLKDFSSPTA
jgi:predicted DNA-binding transcriptional regulator AlpA